MPRQVFMTYVPSQKRWTKMYKGQRYYVSTKDLNCPPTEAASQAAANDWWKLKQAEIDGKTAMPPPGSSEARLRILEAYKGEKIATEDEAGVTLMEMMAHIDTMPPEHQRLFRAAFLGTEKAQRIEDAPSAILDAPTLPEDRTIGYWCKQWEATEDGRVSAGKLGLSRANVNKICLGHFKKWIGETSLVTSINGPKWADWYNFLSGQVLVGKWETSHADRIFIVAKRFVLYLYEMELIERPRNLDNKSFTFVTRPSTITTWTKEEIGKFMDVATNQTRLHVLLMLNCGMNNKDISDLRPEEVNWKTGVITRKRSKTRKEKDTPVVNYKLWASTLKLLREYRSKDKTHVLLTAKANPWIVEHKDEAGKFHRSDMIASCFKYWCKRAGVKKPPKALRATAASKLAESPTYKYYTTYFLCHSPRTVAEKHYVKPTDTEFFEALAWLGNQFDL